MFDVMRDNIWHSADCCFRYYRYFSDGTAEEKYCFGVLCLWRRIGILLVLFGLAGFLLSFFLLFWFLWVGQQVFELPSNSSASQWTNQTSWHQVKERRLSCIKENHDRHGRRHAQNVKDECRMEVRFWKGGMHVGVGCWNLCLMRIESQQQWQEKSRNDNISQT